MCPKVLEKLKRGDFWGLGNTHFSIWCTISWRHGMEGPAACRATGLSFIVTLHHILHPRLSICEKGTPHKVVENTKRMWTTTRNRRKSRLRVWPDQTTTAFQKGKIPSTPFSLLPPAGAMSPPPPVSLSSSPWYDTSTSHGEPFRDASDGPSFSCDDARGPCFWNEGHLWEAMCQWLLVSQWWDLPPVPGCCPLCREWLNKTHKERQEHL